MPTIVFGDNTGDDYSGTLEDTKINEYAPTTNYVSGILDVGHPAAGVPNRSLRTLIRANIKSTLDGLGATAVTAADLYLDCTYSMDSNSYGIGAYRVLLNWLEGSATWNEYGTSSSWNTAGCDSSSDVTGEDSTADRRATAEASTVVAATGWFSWDLATAAEAWRAGTWSEYGVILISAAEDTGSSFREFNQTEHGTDGTRPYLSVTYTTGSISLEQIERHYPRGVMRGVCRGMI